MRENKLLGIPIPQQTKNNILEQIKKYTDNPTGFFHIVSLNPENLVIAQDNQEFKKVIETAQIKIIDGVGVVIAARIHRKQIGERLPGIELMKELIQLASHGRLRVLLIGGKPNLAVRLAHCYQQTYPQAKFLGHYGIKNIKNPKEIEEKTIFSIVTEFEPHIVLAAFGSPEQELWLYRHRSLFKDCLCMGVGGAFDYLSGEIIRAPKFILKIGLEWFYRLIRQPWRWRRQMRLIKFIWLVLFSVILRKRSDRRI